MTEMFYDDDADLSIIQGRKVAIVGYGSQGHAHALNLRDSGVEVVIALKEGSKSTAKAQDAGFTVKNVADAAEWADVIMILAPDQHQRSIYNDSIKDKLTEGKALAFAHGFNIRFGYIEPPQALTSSSSLRRHRATRSAANSKPAVASRTSSPWSRTLPVPLGNWPSPTPRPLAVPAPVSSRRPSPKRPKPTCSVSSPYSAAAFPRLVQYGFETLTEAGYQPQIAYFEVLHELKLIVDLMWKAASPSSAGAFPTPLSTATTSPARASSPPR